MYDHVAQTLVNATGLIQSFRLVSHTKDSLYVRWVTTDEEPQGGHPQVVQGYKVRYQAKDSNVILYSPQLEPHVNAYDIPMLHEDTDYTICIRVFANNSSFIDGCLEASTAVDSLSVALGSTFGAFLALGIIVLFVFVAKWQHTRRLRKQLQRMTPSGDSYDSMVQPDGDYELSDVSLQVHDDTVKMDLSSQSSQVSTVANGTARPSAGGGMGGGGGGGGFGGGGGGGHGRIMRHQASCDSCGGVTAGEEEDPHGPMKHPLDGSREGSPRHGYGDPSPYPQQQPHHYHPHGLPYQNSQERFDDPPSTSATPHPLQYSDDGPATSLLDHHHNPHHPHPHSDYQLHPHHPQVPPQPHITPQVVLHNEVAAPTKLYDDEGRPPDVRPKDKALLELTHLYANKKYFEEPQTSLRPNMSCNW